MEKASKILIFIFLIGVAYLAWSVLIYSPQSEAENIDLKVVVIGRSMLPTLHAGDIVHYSDNDPKVGDIVIFKCHASRCAPTKEEELAGDTRTIKRVSNISNDCYSFLGDNPDHSFDSRSFGPLCGEEVEIEGVATSVDFSQ